MKRDGAQVGDARSEGVNHDVGRKGVEHAHALEVAGPTLRKLGGKRENARGHGRHIHFRLDVNHEVGGSLGKELRESHELVGIDPVVAVDDTEIRAASLRQTCVDRRAMAAVGLADEAKDLGAALDESLRNGSRGVGGAVVNHDELDQTLEADIIERGEATLEVARDVVARHGDRENGRDLAGSGHGGHLPDRRRVNTP